MLPANIFFRQIVKEKCSAGVVKQNFKPFSMNTTLHITAILDQPELLESLVEKLASRRYDMGYSKQAVPKNWQPVETSSTETYVSGTLSLSGLMTNDNAAINMPFITSMLFTCIKDKNKDYKLAWSSSLS
jgi:hypothetical protein